MKFGLIGKKLGHSLSPEIHRAWGLDYTLREVPEDALEGFVRGGELDGFNVTVPYKQSVMSYLDEIDGRAQEIGAVNTVVRRGGRLFGYNTDAGGMEFALKRAGIRLDGKTVAILGTGGTSKTARFVAKELGAKKIFFVGRSSPVNYENVYDQGEINAIINATPVGMYPDNDGCALSVERIDGLEYLFDAVYNPLETELVTRARAAGAVAANGLAMLVEQARLAQNLFCPDCKVGVERSEEILKSLYKSRANIVLIGMPGSGKTAVGRRVAERLKRALIDTDARVLEKTGKTIPQIFAESGEEGFRKIESEVVSECAKATGAVIATGGGAVKNFVNVRNLKRNGKLIFIERDIEKLAKKGRPISESADLKQLYFERLPLYKVASDYAVSNDGDINKTVSEILKIYEKDFAY